MRRAIGALCLAGHASACAATHEAEVVVEHPLAPIISRTTVDASVQYEVETSVKGDVLRLLVEQSERCATVTTARTARERKVTRSVDKAFMGTTWTLAGLGIMLGGYTYMDANGLAEKALQDDPASTATPESFQRLGILFAAGGLLAGVIGIGNQLRSGTHTEDAGTVDGTPSREEDECNRSPASDADLTVRFLDGTELTARTDTKGRAEFALTDLGPAALPRAGKDLRLKVGGRHSLPLGISPEDREEIEKALMANAASRLSQERAKARRAACLSQAADAAAVSDADIQSNPDAAVARWTEARETCADLWTEADEAAATKVYERAAAARCALWMQEIDRASAVGLARDEVPRLDERLRIASACGDTSDLRATQARYRAAVEALMRREQAEAERAELEEQVAELDELLEQGDAESAHRLLRGTPGLRVAASDTTRALSEELLGQALMNVLDGTPSKAEAALQMCHARSVHELVFGPRALRAVVQQFVARNGTANPAFAARVVRALKAGRCR